MTLTFSWKLKCVCPCGMTNVIRRLSWPIYITPVLNLSGGKLASGVPFGFIRLYCETRTAPSISLIRFRNTICSNERDSFVAYKTYIWGDIPCSRQRQNEHTVYDRDDGVLHFLSLCVSGRGRDSVGGISSDSLRAAQSGDRIPVGARFSGLVQIGPRTHLAPYTKGTGYFTGVKRPGCGVEQPPTSSVEVKERVELYLYSHSGTSWSVLG